MIDLPPYENKYLVNVEVAITYGIEALIIDAGAVGCRSSVSAVFGHEYVVCKRRSLTITYF